MKAEEIRGMDDAAIKTDIADKKKKLLELRCSVAMGDEVNPAQLKTIRRDVARMKTILNQKEAAKAGGDN